MLQSRLHPLVGSPKELKVTGKLFVIVIPEGNLPRRHPKVWMGLKYRPQNPEAKDDTLGHPLAWQIS